MKRFLLTAVVVVFALRLVSCGAAASPEATAKRFYKAVAEGDYSRALEYTNIGDEDTELYRVIMEKVRSSVDEKGGIDRIEVSKLQPSQDPEERVAVFVRIGYADGSSQEEYCDVVSVDGKWRVDVDLDSK